MSAFLDSYKSPQWQRVRLEVLQAANFACEECGATDKQLQVHHRIYRKNLAAYLYRNDELIALCAECHTFEHYARDTLKEFLARMNHRQLCELVLFAEKLTQ